MNKIFLSLFLVIALMGTAWANNGWYSTLQGTASDVEQTPPPNGVTIAYNTTDHEWEFNYGLAPAGGTTGTCLEKNSNSDYDYSWVTCSGSGAGNVGIGTTGRIPVYIGSTTIGSPYNNVMDSNGNVGIGTISPVDTLQVIGNVMATNYYSGTLGVTGVGAVSSGGITAIGIALGEAVLRSTGTGYQGDNIDLNAVDGSASFANNLLNINSSGTLQSVNIVNTGTFMGSGDHPYLYQNVSNNKDEFGDYTGINGDAYIEVGDTGIDYQNSDLFLNTSEGSTYANSLCLGGIGGNCLTTWPWVFKGGAGNVGVNTTNTVGIGTFKGSGQLEILGNVGIGTDYPAGNIDVGTGTICLNHTCNSTWPSGGGSNYWSLNGGAGNVGISTTNSVGIGTSSGVGAQLVVMGGNVGIGTWIPGQILQVGNGISPTIINKNGNVSIGTTVSNVPLAVMGGNVGIGTFNPQNTFAVGSTGQFQISSAGNITTPFSGTSSSMALNTSSSGVFYNNNSSSGSSTAIEGGVAVNSHTDIYSTGHAATDTTDYTRFFVNGAGTEVMRIQDNSGIGNIGIGTTFPNHALEMVIGNIGISTTNAASINSGCNGSGVTSCVCKQFTAGICVSCTCT